MPLKHYSYAKPDTETPWSQALGDTLTPAAVCLAPGSCLGAGSRCMKPHIPWLDNEQRHCKSHH